MVFNSLAFLLFFVITTAGYFLCPGRFRWVLLLAASCYFYMSLVPAYILILFGLIGVDFILAQRIEASSGKAKRMYFLGSLISNIGVLFIFKYFNFFTENVNTLAHLIHWNYSIPTLKLLLPLGLSFHTFQSLGYIIEVYKGRQKAERHVGIYALFVLFYPQLVAGPIERPQHLLPQLRRVASLDWVRIFSGLRLMAWGMFKKVVIADRLAMSVDYVYGNLHTVPGLSIFITLIFFAFQLYADFSGYSDIAVGAARVLGFDLTRNFLRPYFSTSVAEFWRRWHISLSAWFRDYLYYPLIYTVKNKTRTWLYICIFLTFLITGLWHGAGWTFVVMGALHGSYLVVGQVTKRFRDRVTTVIGLAKRPQFHRLLQQLITFGLVCLSWVFFRSPNIHDAFSFLSHLFTGWNLTAAQFVDAFYIHPFAALGINRIELVLSWVCIVILLGVELFQEKKSIVAWTDQRPLVVRSMLYSGIILAIIIFGVFTQKEFIYFQF